MEIFYDIIQKTRIIIEGLAAVRIGEENAGNPVRMNQKGGTPMKKHLPCLAVLMLCAVMLFTTAFAETAPDPKTIFTPNLFTAEFNACLSEKIDAYAAENGLDEVATERLKEVLLAKEEKALSDGAFFIIIPTGAQLCEYGYTFNKGVPDLDNPATSFQITLFDAIEDYQKELLLDTIATVLTSHEEKKTDPEPFFKWLMDAKKDFANKTFYKRYFAMFGYGYESCNYTFTLK